MAKSRKPRRKKNHLHRQRPFTVTASSASSRVDVTVRFRTLGRMAEAARNNRDTTLADGIMLAIKNLNSDYRMSTMRTRSHS